MYSELLDKFIQPPSKINLLALQSNWDEITSTCSALNYHWTEWSSATDLNEPDSDGNDYETLKLHRYINSRWEIYKLWGAHFMNRFQYL